MDTRVGQTSHHCDKIPDTNNLREERFISVHSFRVFGPLSLASLILAVVRENIVAAGAGVKATHRMVYRK
jgi:hypothetical protein